MTATLSDRYVWAVLRALPGAQRDDLEPEIRALVADTTEAKAGDERAAVLELGDPSVLAARYVDKPMYLIGPVVFPEWKRLVTTLVAILVPIIAIVSFGASMLNEESFGRAIVSAAGGAFMVAVQTVFWITLVFAAIERTAGPGTIALDGKPWTPDALPDLPPTGRISRVEIGFTIVFDLLLIGFLLWVQLAPPIEVDGVSYPLFDPVLWSFWLPYFIVLTAVDLVFNLLLFRKGRYTYPFAIVNAIQGAAFAIPAIYLVQNALLFNPELVAQISAQTGGGTWIPITTLVTSITIGVIVAWDAVDGFLKAYRADHPGALTM